MIITEMRPLSDFYREDHRRLAARERDRTLAAHRASYAAHQILAEADRLQDIKELHL